MGYTLMDLFLLMLCAMLSGGTNLTVKQEPQVLEVASGGKVNMTCNVTWAEGDRFRVGWKKDGKELLQSTSISRHSKQVTWGSRDKLVLILGDTIILSLGDVNANDSGSYVCHVTMEIPALKKAEGNGTYLIVSDSFKRSWIKGLPGLLLWLLVASVMAGSGAVLGKMIWRFLSRSRGSGNHFYGNVLSYHQKTKATTLAWSENSHRMEPFLPLAFDCHLEVSPAESSLLLPVSMETNVLSDSVRDTDIEG